VSGRDEKEKAMSTIHLLRTGDAPLEFDGDKIAGVSGRLFRGKERNRWHELYLYRAGEKLVLSINYRTQWEGEAEADEVHVCVDDEDLLTILRGFDPAERVQGYPPHEAFAAKQSRLIEDLRATCENLISDLLEEAGIVETL
jgi:hypothetical protein